MLLDRWRIRKDVFSASNAGTTIANSVNRWRSNVDPFRNGCANCATIA
jgi:hypothetical protein